MNLKQRDFAKEEWRPVRGTKYYEVSSLGRVRSLERMVPNGPYSFRVVATRLLKQSVSNGYMRCSVHRNACVHRLVAEAFVKGEEDGLVVNHKDGNRANNIPDNIEWVTSSDNQRHSYRQLGRVNHAKGKFGGEHGAARAVNGACLKTGVVVEYGALEETRRNGFDPNIVSKCVRGVRGYKSHKGFSWGYANG